MADPTSGVRVITDKAVYTVASAQNIDLEDMAVGSTKELVLAFTTITGTNVLLPLAQVIAIELE